MSDKLALGLGLFFFAAIVFIVNICMEGKNEKNPLCDVFSDEEE